MREYISKQRNEEEKLVEEMMNRTKPEQLTKTEGKIKLAETIYQEELHIQVNLELFCHTKLKIVSLLFVLI